MGFGNYGPTLIVRHVWGGGSVFALYGHLGLNALAKWENGDEVSSGTLLAHIGEEAVNGNWPPHLHFQLIREVKKGAYDFPGVCAESELEKHKTTCPNPNALLQSSLLTNSNYP
jgi:peptidoglycan LD-endopeptidase LytH